MIIRVRVAYNLSIIKAVISFTNHPSTGNSGMGRNSYLLFNIIIGVTACLTAATKHFRNIVIVEMESLHPSNLSFTRLGFVAKVRVDSKILVNNLIGEGFEAM